jgi:hypothetical protein
MTLFSTTIKSILQQGCPLVSYVLIGAEARQENRSQANDNSAYLDHPADIGYPSD